MYITKILITLLLTVSAFANENIYTWPVGGNKIITGSFGEYRPSHFHLGLDFGTEHKIGLPIYAILDGQVTGLQSNRYSIGNAIYLELSNGFTARYGHLDKFSEQIVQQISDQSIKEKIIQKADFDYVQIKPIVVKRGELIAYSGKTGIGPPHLHLELFKDGVYYNLLDMGLKYNPVGSLRILSIEIKPKDRNSYINGKNESIELKLSKSSNAYWYPTKKQKIYLKGKFLISASGNESSGGNHIGFQSLALSLNEKELYHYSFEKIRRTHSGKSCLIMNNYESRMNGFPFKYYLYTRYGNNLLGTKYSDVDSGIISSDQLNNGKNLLNISVRGIKNTESVRLEVFPDSKSYPIIEEVQTFNVDSESISSLTSEDKKVNLFFPMYSVFSRDNFSILENKNIPKLESGIELLSKIYTISPDYREFNAGYTLFIWMDNVWKDGTYLVQLNDFGKIKRIISSIKRANLVRARLKFTGHFAIIQDTSKPEILLYKYKDNHKFNNKRFQLNLIIKDTGSGVDINGVKASIDGKEVAVDYDPESILREIFLLDEHKTKGEHILKVSAIDIAKNQSKEFIFKYKVR